jgi:hypothetical protein
VKPFQFLLLVASAALATHAADYSFPAGDAIVKLTVEPLTAYTGTRLAVYSGSKEIPLSAETGFAGTPDHFVGAGALVRYSVESSGRKRRRGVVRERVVLLGQSEGLPARPVYEKTVPLVNGVASDLQLFGYDEDSVAESDRPAAREQAKGMWRHFRQELFLDGGKEPFAVLEWRHTITQIGMNPVPAGTIAARR